MIGLNKIGLNQVQLNLVQLNQLYLNTLCAGQKRSGGDGFPRLPGDVTRWSFKGLTNEMMAKNPRLEDADHKGRFLTFKNFAWGEMSGVGGYTQNYNYSAWRLALDRAETTKTGHSFNVTSVTSTVVAFYYQSGSGQEPFTVKSQIVRVSGLTDGQSIKYGTGKKSVLVIESDGIYTLPPFDFAAKGIWYGFSFGKIQESCNITLEQLPYYPDALVFDGVDDYGICENFPILTEEKGYTVVALRQWIEEKNDSTALVSNCKNWNQDGAFLFEYNNLRINFLNVAISFGHVSSVDRGKSPFSYQTSKLYNGKNIEPGSFIGSNELVVGKGNKDFPTVSKVAIWELIILDHDATEEELTKIKNYFIKTYPWLFFDQAWTVVGKSNEDTDRATIANITGNGNNLVLSNFGFAGNSGYGDYPTLAPKYEYTSDVYTRVFISFSNIKSIRVKFVLTGLLDDNGEKFVLRVRNSTTSIYASTYTKDGTYVFTYEYTGEEPIQLVGYNSIGPGEEYPKGNFTVDIIPDHQGYLVTDGVDDIVASSSFELDKKFTVVGEWKFINNESKRAGIVFPSKLYAYNEKENMLVYINTPITGNTLQNIRSFKALTSDGKLYDNNWEERVLKAGDTGLIRNTITFGGFIQNSVFTQIALKNLGIYNNQTLSKEDCIKAYIYLQTLKAK